MHQHNCYLGGNIWEGPNILLPIILSFKNMRKGSDEPPTNTAPPHYDISQKWEC